MALLTLLFLFQTSDLFFQTKYTDAVVKLYGATCRSWYGDKEKVEDRLPFGKRKEVAS